MELTGGGGLTAGGGGLTAGGDGLINGGGGLANGGGRLKDGGGGLTDGGGGLTDGGGGLTAGGGGEIPCERHCTSPFSRNGLGILFSPCFLCWVVSTSHACWQTLLETTQQPHLCHIMLAKSVSRYL